MEYLHVKISPRMLCPCGKSCRTMTAEERKLYDDAVQRISEASTKREELQADKHGNPT